MTDTNTFAAVTQSLESEAIVKQLRAVAIEMNDTSRRMSAYAVKYGDAEFAQHAAQMAGAAGIAVQWAAALEERQ